MMPGDPDSYLGLTRVFADVHCSRNLSDRQSEHVVQHDCRSNSGGQSRQRIANRDPCGIRFSCIRQFDLGKLKRQGQTQAAFQTESLTAQYYEQPGAQCSLIS